jgi:hypothetical protein
MLGFEVFDKFCFFGCGGRIYKLFRNVKGDHSALPATAA